MNRSELTARVDAAASAAHTARTAATKAEAYISRQLFLGATVRPSTIAKGWTKNVDADAAEQAHRDAQDALAMFDDDTREMISETVNEALATAPAYSPLPVEPEVPGSHFTYNDVAPAVFGAPGQASYSDVYAAATDYRESDPALATWLAVECSDAPCDCGDGCPTDCSSTPDPYGVHSPDTCPSWGVWCEACGDSAGDNGTADDDLPVHVAPWDGLTRATTDVISHAVITSVHDRIRSSWGVVSVHATRESARDARNASSTPGTVCEMRYAGDYGVYLTPDHVVMGPAPRGRTALFSAAILAAANVAASGMGLHFYNSVRSRGPQFGARFYAPTAYARQAYAGTPRPVAGVAGRLPMTAYLTGEAYAIDPETVRAVHATALPALDISWCGDCQVSMIGAEFPYCESCDVNCDRCGEHVSDDDRCNVGDEVWCQYCADHAAVYLDCCGEYVATRDSCFGRCAECGDTRCDSCGFSSCYECGRELCQGCSDRCPCDDSDSYGGGLADSCASPPMTFRGDGPWHLGLELEVAGVPNRIGGDVNASDLSSHVIAKADGSVDGAEFAFSPMTLDYLRTWDGLSELLDAVKPYAHDSSGAGIHVHVSREAFTGTDHMETFGALLGSDVNAHRVSQYARRERSTWAQFRTLPEISQAIAEPNYSPRYSAVNWQALAIHGTAEVRVFRSSVDRETIIGTAALVAAAVEFTALHTGSLVGMDWDEFGAYCLTRDDFHVVASEILRTLPSAS